MSTELIERTDTGASTKTHETRVVPHGNACRHCAFEDGNVLENVAHCLALPCYAGDFPGIAHGSTIVWKERT